MFNLSNFIISERKIISFVILAFILSLLFENYLQFNLGFFRFSIVEVIFFVSIFLNLFIYKFDFLKFVIKIDRKNIFEIIIYSILILKLFKYLLNYQDYYNLYELLIWMYMLSIYLTFKFYLSNNKNFVAYIENTFIFISIILSLHILYSYLIYKLGYESNGLWIVRDSTYYPYVGKSIVNFISLFSHGNTPAHLVAPGFLFLFNRYKNKLILTSLLLCYFFVLYLIKSKFLIIFFGILAIFLFVRNLNLKNLKLINFLLLSSITTLSVFYIIVTHFIIIEKGIINSSNFDIFRQYYFTDFTISLNNYDIYGSLFLKLKSTTVLIANSYNYIFFDSLNYYNHEIVLNYFDKLQDPHSDYFGALANYGILGFLIFLSLPVFIIFKYLKNFDNQKINNNSFIYFLIIIMFLIEALVSDILHTQYIWIIFAMYFYNISNEKINYSSI